jgi:hypothetical protein
MIYRLPEQLLLEAHQSWLFEERVMGQYKVHRFDIRMTRDQSKLEQFLNNLEGEVIAIIPNVTIDFLWVHRVDFLLIVEKLG